MPFILFIFDNNDMKSSKGHVALCSLIFLLKMCFKIVFYKQFIFVKKGTTSIDMTKCNYIIVTSIK